jgi:hypothetical protein
MRTSNSAVKKGFLRSAALLVIALISLLVIMNFFKINPVAEAIATSSLAHKIKQSSLVQSFTGTPKGSLSSDTETQQAPDLTTAEAKVLKEFPHLASSYRLTHKVLKSSDEWDEIRAVHSDYASIADSTNYLTQDQNISEDLTLAHFRHLDYLKRVLTLKDNPAEDFAFEKVAEILNYEPKNYANLSEAQKQLLFGDKIDLIYVLQAYSPAVLQKILEQSEKKRLAKMVKYAEENRQFLQLVDL